MATHLATVSRRRGPPAPASAMDTDVAWLLKGFLFNAFWGTVLLIGGDPGQDLYWTVGVPKAPTFPPPRGGG